MSIKTFPEAAAEARCGPQRASLRSRLVPTMTSVAVLGALLISNPSPVASTPPPPARETYRVTVENLTDGQPLSFAAAATHLPSVHMFSLGQPASAELEAIAEFGKSTPMVELFDESAKATDVVALPPLLPEGTQAPTFPIELSHEVEFEIEGRSADRFSLVSMLVCTNDGVTGLDAVMLPKAGETAVFLTSAYDAGTEENIEESQYIVDSCSALDVPPLGEPDVLPGDPDGNDRVASDASEPVHVHPGIAGTGELDPAVYGWDDEPVARVTITMVDD